MRSSLTGNFGQERQQAGDFGYASGMTTRQTLAAFTLGVLFVACPPAQPTCAAGQVLKSGACVAEVTCGDGTTAVDGACVATVRLTVAARLTWRAARGPPRSTAGACQTSSVGPEPRA